MDLKHYFTSPLEAVQVKDDNMEEIATWCGGRVVHDSDKPYVWVPVPENSKITAALPGMWITRRCVISLKNEIKYTFSIFRPDYFKKNYFDSPAGAVDATWEKADRQKTRKKNPKQRAAEAIVKDGEFEEMLGTRFAEMQAQMNDLTRRLNGAFVENDKGQFVPANDPMSDAIIVKPTDVFAHEVLQNAENQQVEDAGTLVAQHLGLQKADLPNPVVDSLPAHMTESQLEGMDEADVERVLNREAVFVHHHKWTEICAEVGCEIPEYDEGPHKSIFEDKTFAISAFGAAAEIESQYEEVTRG